MRPSAGGKRGREHLQRAPSQPGDRPDDHPASDRQPRTIEIVLHDKDGLLFISGMPRADRTRDWIHNITADPQVVVHLKQRIAVDIPATARMVTDPGERRQLMAAAAQRWGRTDVDEMVRHSPLIVLTVADADERATEQ